MKVFLFSLPFLLMSSWGLSQQSQQIELQINPNPLHIKKSHFHRDSLPVGTSTRLSVEILLDEGHTAYVEQFKLSVKSPAHVSPLTISPQKAFYDRFSQKEKMGVKKKATIQAFFQIPKDFPLGQNLATFDLRYQACTKSYCLLPKTLEFQIPFTTLPPNSDSQLQPPTRFIDTFLGYLDQQIKKAFSHQSWLILLLIAFLGGLMTSLLPCIYPMIPITMAVLGATQSGTSQRQTFTLSLCYVLGIASTYSILGATAASTGKLFGALLGNTYVVIFLALILVVMSLSLFGLFEITMPPSLARLLGLHRPSSSVSSRPSYLGAFISGLVFGIVASPCVGPVLISILTYVAQTQDIVLGGTLLFVFALGFGQLFIVLGLSMQSLKRLPKSGPWMNIIRYLGGVLILLIAASYIYPIWPLNQTKTLPPHILTKDSAFLPWQEYSAQTLKKAASEGQGVIIDFYADWCSACKQLEVETFRHPSVQELGKNFVWIKFNSTQITEVFQKLSKKYSILSLPHIVFYDTQGNYRKELTLNKFESPPLFIERMKKAL